MRPVGAEADVGSARRGEETGARYDRVAVRKRDEW
jgi:hypothetical protein